MKSRVLLPLVAVAAAVLLLGLVLGVRPISGSVTMVNPEVVELTVPCGIGYLPGLPAGSGETVPVPNRPGLLLPRGPYEQQCDQASGARPYLAWGLTGAGLLGVALLVVGRRNRVDA